ncbi:MAG: hypothetical protein EZS28_022405, partial [Streblomastix strix]
MCIECIECIGSQADRLDSRQIRHIVIKLAKWTNDMNCSCASSALSALGHKLIPWIPAILDIMPQIKQKLFQETFSTFYPQAKWQQKNPQASKQSQINPQT